MGKIPVGRTIAQSYKFAFGHYLTVLGVVWLPMLASMALSYYFRGPLLAQMMAQAHGDLAAVFRFQRISFLIQLAALVFGAIISVGISKEVLGMRRGWWRLFYAGFGVAELRVIVGYFALFLLSIVFVVGFFMAVGIFGVASSVALGPNAAPAAKGVVALGVGVAAIGLWLALIYAFVRLTFLFLPVTVAEKRIGILRSWELTSGNFWRIFIIGIAVLLPLIAVAICAWIFLLGTGYIDFVIQHRTDPAAVQKFVMDRITGIYGNPVILAVNFLLAPVAYGLMISPASFAYRALMPLPEAGMAAPPPSPAAEPVLKEIAEIVDGSAH